MRRWLAIAGAVCLAATGCSGSEEDARPTVTVAPSDAADVAESEEIESVDPAGPLACLPLEVDGWSRSAGPLDGPHLLSMATNDRAIVLVGAEGSSGVVAMHSDDGLAWDRADGFPSMPDSGMPPEVAGGPEGFVTIATLNGATPNTPLVAFSADGTSWEQIDPSMLPTGRIAWLSNVFAGPEGFVIVGSGAADDEALSPNELLMWHSPDGLTWSETDLPQSGMESVAVAPNGSGWVALTSGIGVDATLRVWTSPSGMRWSETETDTVPPADSLMSYVGTAPLMITEGAFVLARSGSDVAPETETPVVWVSTDDGVTWNEHAVGGDPASSGFGIYDTAVTDFGFALAGTEDTSSDVAEYFVHHSADGIAWEHCWTSPTEIIEIEQFGEALVAIDAQFSDVHVWNAPA